jgi:hypothetical protein
MHYTYIDVHSTAPSCMFIFLLELTCSLIATYDVEMQLQHTRLGRNSFTCIVPRRAWLSFTEQVRQYTSRTKPLIAKSSVLICCFSSRNAFINCRGPWNQPRMYNLLNKKSSRPLLQSMSEGYSVMQTAAFIT